MIGKKVLLSPAKLNLFLFVGGKREDGYHEVFYIAEKINVFDKIEIEVKLSSKGFSINFLGKWKVPENNTVKKALLLMTERFGDFGVNVSISKIIPPGSGMGGGSSNAGVIIREVGSMFSREKEKLLEIASQVGSDVPLFVLDFTDVLCEGRGEKVKGVILKGERFYTVLWPSFESSTAQVYGKFEKKGNDFHILSSKVKKLLIEKSFELKFEDLEDFLGVNFLEEAFFKIFPFAKDLKDELEKFAEKVWVTGSGSSFVLFYRSKRERDRFFEKVKERFPSFHIWKAEPLSF